MSTLPKITVNVDEMIGVNKYSVDEGGSHIGFMAEDVDALDEVEFLKLVKVCPAALYKIGPDGRQELRLCGLPGMRHLPHLLRGDHRVALG